MGLSDYQSRRSSEKFTERERRLKLMNGEIPDVTPTNGEKLPWALLSDEKFDNEWNMRPVALKGYFDHFASVSVEKIINGKQMITCSLGEKIYEVVTPFYTHLDDNGKECGLLVNRGTVGADLEQFNYQLHEDRGHITITGYLYKGDAQNKYSRLNEPMVNLFYNVKPRDLSLYTHMPNYKDGADKVMFKMVDMDQQLRHAYPCPPTSEELLHFEIEPERHEAYSKMWSIFTFLNVLANTALWIYF